MPGAFERVKSFLGMDALFEEEEDFVEERPQAMKRTPKRTYTPPAYDPQPIPKRNKVVNINTTATLDVVIVSPESFDEAQDIADNIKSKRPCVMNLEMVDKAVARRIVDFLSGAVYAADGNIQKVSNGIFLITPYNVNIMGDFRDALGSKSGLF